MIAAGLNNEYGVLASDSAVYDTATGQIDFNEPKLSVTKGPTVLSYIGTPLYFSTVETAKLSLPFDAQCLYFQSLFQKERDNVAKLMKEQIKDKDEQQPHFCLFILGVYNKVPTLAQLNSYKDFNPIYLSSKDDRIVFSNIFYGGDNEKKKKVFSEAKEFMETKASKMKNLTPGLVGEILTRGIYKKADLEQKIDGKKYAGGVVNAAYITQDNRVTSLSGFRLV